MGSGMFNLTRRSLLSIAAIGIVALSTMLVASLTVAAAPPTPGPAPVLKGVDPNRLAETGIRLDAPSGTPAISKARAEQVALQRFSGSTIRETVLVEFRRETFQPLATPRLAWVVSIDLPMGNYHPSSGPMKEGGKGEPRFNTGPIPASYCLIFVDAATGKFILGSMS